MSRFLLVVPPLVGHINPLVGVAAELRRRGHQVAWAGHTGQIRALAGEGSAVYDCQVPEVSRPPDLTGPAAFRLLWRDVFLPLARRMAPGVRAALHAFEPDLVVADQHALAGALVAEASGVPWVTTVSTSAELADPLAGMPKVAAWLAELLAGLRAEIGDPAATGDPRFSPYGSVAFTGRELLGGQPLPAPGIELVGPVVADRPERSDFPWHRLPADRPLVLVSLGTANVDAGDRFLREALAALGAAGDRLAGVLVDPAGTLADTTPPRHVLVLPRVPQLALLPRMSAVVCHGGHNTVCESLWHGVPLVVAPIRDDQPIVAGQVVAAGAGVRVRFGRVTAAGLDAALATVLDPANGHRAAARAAARSLRAAGGAGAAADLLTRVAAGRLPTPTPH
ncbi:glycosyltransferase [Streptomyces sp. DSM 44915]|uniref:Glycosyltransferase n=1 Tax=Streptomyces chisholmiae TaxID=3075540 RepID=A0ABU2JVE7_9ACTN|nr:glycosyltransferase [Streptomyces sp. DSM 44915]MDT0268950.1 glycosyltransferase [Streptomyces sp. DSM 44915]